MELRDIEIFLTLAEEPHFTRTAERLHVSTARVSQAIRKQEREVGAKLFERRLGRVSRAPPGVGAAYPPQAQRGSVSLEALGDFGVLRPSAALPGYWEDAFVPFETPSGRPIARAPAVREMDDILTIVGTGEAVHHLGAHAARYYARPGVLYLPLRDAPRLRWGLVWRSDAETEPIRALARVVRDLGTAAL